MGKSLARKVKTMQDTSVEGRRGAVVARLKSMREAYERCLSDVTADVANEGSEWAIVDLLRHVNGDVFRNRIKRLLEEDNPQLPGFDRQGAWQQLRETSVATIDEALGLATTLTPDQLARAGERAGQAHTVIDALERWLAHFEEHMAQLRDELRPREGLPEV